MKRIAILSACILSAAAVSSCSKQEEPVTPIREVSIIYATLPQPVSDSGTKTELGGITSGKYPILWSRGDAVAVVPQGSAAITRYTLSDESAGKKFGQFIGESVTGPVYAYYPCENVKYISGHKFKVSIPATQTYSSASFGKGAMPTYGVSSSADSIQLNSLMSVLKVQLTGSAKVNWIMVISKGQFLSGEATVDMTDGTVDFVSGSRSVDLVCEEPVQLTSAPTTFHIVLPACTEEDFTVLVKTDAGYMKKTLTKKDFKVNTIKKMNAVEFEANVVPYIEDLHYYGEGIPVGGVVWAPVNCGVGADSSSTHGCGMLYQWGRLYGQARDGVGLTAMTMEQGQSEEYKDKLSWYNKTDYNWFSSGLVDTLWNTGTEKNPKKTIYDPCPDGWRVPTRDEFGALCYTDWGTSTIISELTLRGSWNGTKKGWDYDTVFLPATGYRNIDSGWINYRGDEGSYWSSSLYDERRMVTLAFDNRVVFTSYLREDFRAYAHSIRCVLE